jgi:hypothetical protein
MLKLIRDCFTSDASYQRAPGAPHKKDDNFGNEEIQQWAASWQLPEDLSESTDAKIQKFISDLIKTLPLAQISESNIHLVEAHLVLIANSHQRYRDCLLEKLGSLKHSDQTQQLKWAVFSAVPRR